MTCDFLCGLEIKNHVLLKTELLCCIFVPDNILSEIQVQ